MSIPASFSKTLPDGWKTIPLDQLKAKGEYTFVGGPFGSNLTSEDYKDPPGVPVIRGTNLGGDTGRFVDDDFVFVSESKAESLFRNLAYPGDLVFTQRGTLGQIVVIPEDARFRRYVVSQSQMKLTVDGSLASARYVYHYFRSPQALALLKSRIQATGVPHINLGILKEFPVILPSLPRQRRIAAVLDKADAIRRMREEGVRLTEELLRATFLNIVGPANPSYSVWPAYRIEDLAARTPGSLRTGPFGSTLRHSEFVDHGIAVLGIDNAVQNRFAWGERRFITPGKYEELRKYTAFPGDVIVTIMGTTGRSAVLPDDLPTGITTKHLATITVNRELILPEILSESLIYNPTVLAQIRAANRGAIMEGLNLGVIRRLEIRTPPLDQQRRYSGLRRAQLAVVEKRRLANTRSEALFDSLVQRAFRGEL